jgi:hypothetical protein
MTSDRRLPCCCARCWRDSPLCRLFDSKRKPEPYAVGFGTAIRQLFLLRIARSARYEGQEERVEVENAAVLTTAIGRVTRDSLTHVSAPNSGARGDIPGPPLWAPPTPCRHGRLLRPTRRAAPLSSLVRKCQQATSRSRRVVAQQSHPNEIDGLMPCLISSCHGSALIAGRAGGRIGDEDVLYRLFQELVLRY